jgi:tRNA(Ile)-lysidine synthase
MNKKSLSANQKIHNHLLKFLSYKKIFKIYSNFVKQVETNGKSDKIGVAVSGGPDSLALAFFTKCFSIKKNINCYFFLVDHGLRKESQKEAKYVASELKKFNIFIKLIKWKGKKPKSNIHHYARIHRYDLVLKNCKKMKIKKLLLGHHQDDLIENFFIRLFRGSGLKGLASFGAESGLKEGNIKIIRPLINHEKSDLEYVSKKVFKFFINDPSNTDEKFTRSRIRNFLKLENFDLKKLKLTLKNLNKSDQAIEHYVKKNIDENCKYLIKKRKIILSENFFQNSEEIVFRSLNYIFTKISKKNYPPRGRKMLDLVLRINSKNFKKTTLGGCLIEKINKTVMIYKE